jgi:hypothetical protein
LARFPYRRTACRSTCDRWFTAFLRREAVRYASLESCRSPGCYNLLKGLDTIAVSVGGEVRYCCRIGLRRCTRVQVTGNVIIADPMSVEKTTELSVLLCNPPRSMLHLRGRLDTLQLIHSESLLQLLEILSSAGPGSPLIISNPGKVCFLL